MSKLSKREKILVLVMLILVCCYLGGRFVITPLLTGYVDLQAQVSELESERMMAEQKINTLPSQRDALDAVSRDVRAGYISSLEPMTVDLIDDMIYELCVRYRYNTLQVNLLDTHQMELYPYGTELNDRGEPVDDAITPVYVSASEITVEMDGDYADFVLLIDEFNDLEYVNIEELTIRLADSGYVETTTVLVPGTMISESEYGLETEIPIMTEQEESTEFFMDRLSMRVSVITVNGQNPLMMMAPPEDDGATVVAPTETDAETDAETE